MVAKATSEKIDKWDIIRHLQVKKKKTIKKVKLDWVWTLTILSSQEAESGELWRYFGWPELQSIGALSYVNKKAKKIYRKKNNRKLCSQEAIFF